MLTREELFLGLPPYQRSDNNITLSAFKAPQMAGTILLKPSSVASNRPPSSPSRLKLIYFIYFYFCSDLPQVMGLRAD